MDKYGDAIPLSLHCGHTFCSTCLYSLFKEGGVVCPVDRQRSAVERVEGLPKNYALLELMNHRPCEQPEVVVTSCNVCETEHMTTHVCLDCNEDMCDTTAAVHKRQKATVKHRVHTHEDIRANPRMAGAPSPICREHDQPLAFYDTVCQRPICRDCTVINHIGHQCQSMADASRECQRDLQAQVARAETMRARMEDASKAVVAVQSDLSARLCQEDRRLTTSFAQLQAVVNARADELHQKLKAMAGAKQAALAAQSSQQEIFIAGLYSVCARAKDALAQSQDAALLLARAEVTAALDTMELNPPPTCPANDAALEVTPHAKPVVAALSAAGEVSDRRMVPANCTANANCTKAGGDNTWLVVARDEKKSPLNVGGDVVEATFEPKVPHRVTDEGNGTYKLQFELGADCPELYTLNITARGQPVRGSPFAVRPTNLLCTPWKQFGNFANACPQGAAVCGQHLIVCSADAKCMRIFNLEGNCVRTFGDDPEGKQPEAKLKNPRGVACSDTEVFVCDGHRIVVFDATGQFLRAFGEPGAGAGQLKAPGGIALVKGNLLVSDTGNKRVQILSTEGKPIRDFGTDRLRHPTGIASYGNEIFVCDQQSVHVYTEEGVFQRTLAGYTAAVGIAITQRGHVVVSDQMAKLSMCTTAGVAIHRWGAELKIPHAICLAGDRLYAFDRGQCRVYN
jgi:hypothetical protein